MKNNRIILISISVMMLVMGLILYLLLNRTAFVSKLLLSFFPVSLPEYGAGGLISLVQNYGADFLWSTAFVLLIQGILFLNKKNIWKLFVCGLLGFVYEILQYFGIANGTSDIIDVLVYFIGSAFGIIIILGGKLYEKK